MSTENQAAQSTNNAATDSTQTPAANTETVVTTQAEQTPQAATSTQEKTQTPATTEQKETETAAKPDGKAEITYDLKKPEGSLLSDARLEKVLSYAKENNLSNEQAQGLLNRESEAVKEHNDLINQQMADNKIKWRQEAEADKEIGGEKFSENVEMAHRAMKTFFDPKLADYLNETGLGNHPMLIKGLMKVGRSMSNDKLVLPGGAPKQERSAEDVLYGGSNNNN